MRTILSSIILILQSQFLYAQYQVGEPGSFDEFTDVFSGPVPKWRPQGDGYAFLSSAGIVIKIGDSTQIVRKGRNNFEWSHSGESIVYSAKDSMGTVKVYRYFLKTSVSELLSFESDWPDFYPTISPNDSVITYHSAKDSPFKIYYWKGGVTRKIVVPNPIDSYLHPQWSPKGNYLSYFKENPENVFLEVMEFESKRVVLSIDANKFDFYDWSPDEKEILVREHTKTIDNRNFYDGTLAKINIETTQKTTLTKRYTNIFSASWSKETDKIIFSANGNVYVIDSNGQNQYKIFSHGYFPDIHPNGQKIIFVGKGTGIPLYEIDLDGKNLKLLEPKTFEEAPKGSKIVRPE